MNPSVPILLPQPSAASLPVVGKAGPGPREVEVSQLEIGGEIAREIGAVLPPFQRMPPQSEYDARRPVTPVLPMAQIAPAPNPPDTPATLPPLPTPKQVHTQPTWQIHFAPQITIQAPVGSEPQALAELLEHRLRALLPLAIREATRSSNAAMYD